MIMTLVMSMIKVLLFHDDGYNDNDNDNTNNNSVPMISIMIRIVSMLQGSSSRMSTVSTGSAGTDFTCTLFMMKLFCKASQYTVKT
jgi:hypothetical protein